MLFKLAQGLKPLRLTARFANVALLTNFDGTETDTAEFALFLPRLKRGGLQATGGF